jgi:hypothetical protein
MPKSKEWLVHSEHTYLYIIKTSHYYNSALKYLYVLHTTFKSPHLAYNSTSTLHITTIILRYYLNFKFNLQFSQILETNLVSITYYNIPLRCKTELV